MTSLVLNPTGTYGLHLNGYELYAYWFVVANASLMAPWKVSQRTRQMNTH